ncbi:MAG TPA: thymidine kinase [Spirochaetia bacterium]|nr:thymidine kinase [Spirochaetia bacterium]
MDAPSATPDTRTFLKSLGFPAVRVHQSFNHFDFSRPARRILVIGSMGSGKTEFSARIWRDSEVARRKTGAAAESTRTDGADRRIVFFIRSALDTKRFPDYPPDALPYRGGYVRCGKNIAEIADSFDLERVMADNPEAGTWVIDEASFYEERLAYVVERASRTRGLTFIFPSLVLNFRREIFNTTARLLLDTATDVFPLTAYCEHAECLQDSFYTYRFYSVDGRECPALYFDPLLVIGGDREVNDPREPNYCTRCDDHHYLPGKEYTFLNLKPLGEQASRGQPGLLRDELAHIRGDLPKSILYKSFRETGDEMVMNSLKVSCIAEKALLFLFTEQNLVPNELFLRLVKELDLDRDYLQRRLSDCRRASVLEQP